MLRFWSFWWIVWKTKKTHFKRWLPLWVYIIVWHFKLLAKCHYWSNIRALEMLVSQLNMFSRSSWATWSSSTLRPLSWAPGITRCWQTHRVLSACLTSFFFTSLFTNDLNAQIPFSLPCDWMWNDKWANRIKLYERQRFWERAGELYVMLSFPPA